MTQRRMAAALMAAALMLVSCGASDTPGGAGPAEPGPSPAVSTTAGTGTVDSSPTTSATPAAPGLIDDDTGEVITPRAVPEWDSASRAAATAAAEESMRAFARPDLDQDSWWGQLEPLLSSEAQINYAYVDPANIPASHITAEPSLTEDASAHIAHVSVPTDIGEYTILLSRQDATAPWLAERITPPEAAN